MTRIFSRYIEIFKPPQIQIQLPPDEAVHSPGVAQGVEEAHHVGGQLVVVDRC